MAGIRTNNITPSQPTRHLPYRFWIYQCAPSQSTNTHTFLSGSNQYALCQAHNTLFEIAILDPLLTSPLTLSIHKYWFSPLPPPPLMDYPTDPQHFSQNPLQCESDRYMCKVTDVTSCYPVYIRRTKIIVCYSSICQIPGSVGQNIYFIL